MKYIISKPLFWTTTVVIDLSFSIWLFSAPIMGEQPGVGKMILFTILYLPVFFGPVAACGWIVAVIYALLCRNIQNDGGENFVKPKGVSRYTVVIMIGSFFATAITPVAENHLHNIYGEMLFLIWTAAFFVAFLFMLFLFHILKMNSPSQP